MDNFALKLMRRDMRITGHKWRQQEVSSGAGMQQTQWGFIAREALRDDQKAQS